MFSSTEMQDLGLGSLPDLDFAERLDGVYNNQDLVRDGQLEDEYSSLFRELEEFNDGLMRQEELKKLVEELCVVLVGDSEQGDANQLALSPT